MEKESRKVVEVDGTVKECLPNTEFVIEISFGEKTREVVGYLSGKMRMHYIRILEGDKVKVQLTPYDKERGRVVYRYK